jgi:hypothetical protein
MGADNFDKLGFDVEVGGAETAVQHLDDIIERLEKIQALKGGKSNGNTPSAPKSEEAKYIQRITKQTELLNSQKFIETRRTEILNIERRKEIDQRIKQELGIQDATKAWGKYIAKLSSAVVLVRKFGHFMADAIKESAEYIENLNLFAVAFGESYQEQLDWALGIADAYGLANNEVVKFAGTFRELSTSLGVVGETADLVSQTVVKLGYDLSSLYNTSVENAMQALQSSVFAGQTKPLRRFGIDISQNQINALFEASEALASLGANARNLTQSDKAIARLIITLQSGGDSFGTMAREINNLQSQFRIFQGSLSNFKLAIGDMFEKPMSRVMVLANAVVIAMTDIIRAFVPLKTTDETTKVKELGADAEYASDEMDNLNGKLAGFDKFNVLTEAKGDGSNLAVTEALNKMLEEQVALYDQDLSKAMEEMTNKATDLADKIKPLIIGLGVLATTLFIKKNFSDSWALALLSKESGLSIANTAKELGNLSKVTTVLGGALKFLTSPLGIILTVVGVLYATNENFRNSINDLVSSLMPLFNILLKLVSDILEPIIPLVGSILELVGYVATAVVKLGDVALSGLVTGLIPIVYILETIVKLIQSILMGAADLLSLDWSGFKKHQKDIWSNWSSSDFAKSALSNASSSVPNLIKGYADGGYSNANLIMTHENGKREWVGKAAGSSAIVNDTQMSDIMEVAVAKGVYNALSARSAMGGNLPTNETIVVKIGEEAVFNAVRKTARRQGRDFANV